MQQIIEAHHAIELVTVEQVAFNCRLTTNPTQTYNAVDRSQIQSLIQTAYETIEGDTSKHFLPKTIKVLAANTEDAKVLPHHTIEVLSVAYIDNEQVVHQLNQEDYYLTENDPPNLVFNTSINAAQRADAIRIRLKVGFDENNLEKIPRRFIHAVLLLVTHWYENPSATSPLAIKEVPKAYDSQISGLRAIRV